MLLLVFITATISSKDPPAFLSIDANPAHLNPLRLPPNPSLSVLPDLSSILLYLLTPSDYGNIFKWVNVLGINNFKMNNKALIEEAGKERQVIFRTIILK